MLPSLNKVCTYLLTYLLIKIFNFQLWFDHACKIDQILTLLIQQLMDWHRPRVKALLEAGVDILALETIPAQVLLNFG